MKASIAVVALFLLVVAARAQTPASAQQAAPAGNAEAGKKLWVSVGCWQCHGYEAQGGAAGPRLAGRNLPFAGVSAYVRKPTNQMPLYTEKVLLNADLANIYAYIQSRPAPPQNILLLQK
jgi:mono/diheme cytochrome c family protein